MNDLRDLLDDEARRVAAAPGALSSVLRRVEVRRRTRRAITGVVALVVAGAGLALAFRTFASTGAPVGPGSEASEDWPGIWPQVSREEAEIAQSRADRGDDRLTHQLDANIFVHTVARDGLHWTDVAFEPFDDEAAQGSGPLTTTVRGCPFDDSPNPHPIGSESEPRHESCPHEAEVTIERLLRRDPTGIWIVTGVTIDGRRPDVHRSPLPPVDSPDSSSEFDSEAPGEVGELAWDFIEARKQERPVDEYLSPGAERAYESGEGGLSLFGYAAQAHTLTLWAITEAENGWRVVVGFQGSGGDFPDNGIIRETLLIGRGSNIAGESLDWVVLDAERNE